MTVPSEYVATLADVRQLALQAAMSRNAQFEQHDHARHRTAILAACLGCVATVLAGYDFALVVTSIHR